MNAGLAARREQIPPELIVDFDIFKPPGAGEDVHLAWRALRHGPPIVWTPRNGGHWIASRGSDIFEMQTNHQIFSYKHVTVPPSSTPSLPLEVDPPNHARLRALIGPLFTADLLQEVEAQARALVRSMIEGLYPSGHCEFIRQFARHLPVVIFLTLVELPLEDREKLLEQAEKRVRSPDPAERNLAKEFFVNYLRNVISTRTENPGSDLISRILHGKGDDKLTGWEAENMLATILSGGLDTVASTMGYSMRYLALHPQHMKELAETPTLIPNAVDELIRRHGVANTARVIAKDCVYNGVQFRKDDQIVVPNSLYGLDPEKFENPLDVQFRRPDAHRHAAFGNGPHRCPGANLARLELRIVLEEWLKRIPEFAIDPDGKVVLATGIINTVHQLPLVWKPAQ